MGYTYEDQVMAYDTDYQGVAHYSSYYRLVTNAISSFAEKKLKRVLSKHKNLWFVIVESHANYMKPLHMGDRIKIKIKPQAQEKKVIVNFEIHKDKEITTKGYLVQMLIDREKWKSVSIPEDIRNAVK